MKLRLAIPLAMLFCLATHVTSTADLPPIAYVAGFGHATDDHMNVVYKAFAQTRDAGAVGIRLECRPMGSVNPADWTTMGLGAPVGGDLLLWSVVWQPCLLSGNFELRMVASDSSGNAPDLQPILYVNIVDCQVRPIGQSESSASVWFEDRAFDEMGLVHAEVDSPELHPAMLAVYEGQSGSLATETIPLFTPDPENPAWHSGSFDPSPIQHGGVGRFWAGYNDYDHRTTHLSSGQLTVGRVEANGNSQFTNDQICARITCDPGALDESNSIVLFPSRIPTLNIGSPIQIWPNCATGDLATAIRLMGPQGFPSGTYAQVQISYRSSVPDECLDVERLGGPPLMGVPGLPHGSIGGGIAVFQLPLSELEGAYAVVSGSRPCEQQPALPKSPFLAQNYPNPFNTSTVIPFGLEAEGEWTLDVFNILGQGVRSFRGHDAAGARHVTWDGLDGDGHTAASGIYLYRLTSGEYSTSKTMLLIK